MVDRKVSTGQVYPPNAHTALFTVRGALPTEILSDYVERLPEEDSRKEGSLAAIQWTKEQIGAFLTNGGGFTTQGEPVARDLTVLQRSPTFVNHLTEEGVVRTTVEELCRDLNLRSLSIKKGKKRFVLPDGAALTYLAAGLDQRLYYTLHNAGGIHFDIVPHPHFPNRRESKGSRMVLLLGRYVDNYLKIQSEEQALPCAFTARSLVNAALLEKSKPLSTLRTT